MGRIGRRQSMKAMEALRTTMASQSSDNARSHGWGNPKASRESSPGQTRSTSPHHQIRDTPAHPDPNEKLVRSQWARSVLGLGEAISD